MASTGFFSPQRNAQQHRNANAGTTLKRRSDNRGYGNGIGGFQGKQNRYAPPQKRFRSQPQQQPQTQFRSDKIPLYHHHNMSRVSQSYNYGVDSIASNSSFALHNNDSNTNYHQKPFVGYANPNPQNPQIVPIPLPYRKLNDDVSFDSLPDWVPNQSVSRTLTPNFVPNHSNLVSIVSQSMMTQPIVVSKELSDLLNVLNNEKEKETSEASNSNGLPIGLSFDDPSSLKIRHESVIKSLYSDMPRQCSACGNRFKCQEDHSKHLDWHARRNRMAKTTTRLGKKPQKSRGWLASASLWLIAETGGTVEAAKPFFGINGETQKKEEEKQQQVVPADENQKVCALCVEPFEEFFSHEADDWMYKEAVYLTKNGPIVHAKCMPEPRPAKDLREPRMISVTVPSVASAIVC